MPREVFSRHEGWHQSFPRRSEIFIDSADLICVTKDVVKMKYVLFLVKVISFGGGFFTDLRTP